MDKRLLTFVVLLAAAPAFAEGRAPEFPDLNSLLQINPTSLAAESFPEDIDAEPAARGPQKDHAAFDLTRLAGDYKLVSCQQSGNDLSNVALPEGVLEILHYDMSLEVDDGAIKALDAGDGFHHRRIFTLMDGVNAAEAKTHDASPHMSGARRDKSVEAYSFKDGVVQRFRVDERALLIYKIYWDHFDTVLTLDAGKLVIEQWRDYGFKFPLDGKTRRFSSRERCEFTRQ